MTKPLVAVPPLLAMVLLALPASHHVVVSSFVTSSTGTLLVARRRGAVGSSSYSCLALDAHYARASSLADAPQQQTQQQQSQRRRDVLASLFSITSSAAASQPAWASSLLEDYGADLSNVNQKKVATTTSSSSATKKSKELARDKGKIESSMEPNLRSNYYYPTNKVRYLPRIKKCSDAIPGAAAAIGNEDWDAVRDFATVVADDTLLPMKLYVSSLSGGGTNVKVGFAKDMMASAKSFEKQQSLLVKSVDRRDVAGASSALEGMAEAMLAYRTVGRLLGPDGGGDIPSVDEIRRSTKRFRGEAFEAKVKERDARIKAAAAAEAGSGSDST